MYPLFSNCDVFPVETKGSARGVLETLLRLKYASLADVSRACLAGALGRDLGEVVFVVLCLYGLCKAKLHSGSHSPGQVQESTITVNRPLRIWWSAGVLEGKKQCKLEHLKSKSNQMKFCELSLLWLLV